MKKIKDFFKKEKSLSYYEKKEIEMKVLLDTLYKEMHKEDDYNYSNWFSIKNFLENKIEQYINTNINKYFNINYWQNQNLDNICKNILERKLEEKFDEYFTKETSEYITEELTTPSSYKLYETKAFENFFKEYLEKNKVNTVINLHKMIDSEKFINTLWERIGDEIWDMVQEKLKSCSY